MVIFSTTNYADSYNVVFAVFVAAFVHRKEKWNPKLPIYTVNEVGLMCNVM